MHRAPSTHRSYRNLNYNFLRDFAPVAGVNRIPLILEVNPAFPAKTVAELIAYAKANPGKLNLATPGIGSAPDVAAELLKMTAGIDIVVVRYRGTPAALADVLGGQVQAMFDAVPTSIGHIRAGKLTALAVATAEPLEVLPGVPTVAQTVPGYEAAGWCGLARRAPRRPRSSTRSTGKSTPAWPIPP